MTRQPDIDTFLRRLSHIPLEHQINCLRSEIAKHPHSHLAKMLEPVLQKRVLKALRMKPVHRTSQPASAVIGHQEAECASA